MEAYFEADDANEDGSDAKKEKIKISERFRRNIIRPFRDYTDKENWVEQYKQAQGDGIGYFRREFIRKMIRDQSMDFTPPMPMQIRKMELLV